MTREDRKKKRIRQLRIRVSFFCIVMAALIGLIYIGIKTRKEDSEKEVTKVKEEIQEEQLSEVSEEVLTAKTVALEAGAPDAIIELLDKNTETVDFVECYGELKDIPPAETVGELPEDGSLPHLLQWDKKWGYQPYGDSFIAASGCGPTCLSMVITGLTGNEKITPYVLAKYAQENGYMIDAGGTYAAFMRDSVTEWGIIATESLESESFVQEETAKGKPIACNLNPGKYFTDVGHFIVITGYEDGIITVLDPFSIKNTEQEWKYSDIKEQIAGLYSYEVVKTE